MTVENGCRKEFHNDDEMHLPLRPGMRLPDLPVLPLLMRWERFAAPACLAYFCD
jgi:hypothetical protein